MRLQPRLLQSKPLQSKPFPSKLFQSTIGLCLGLIPFLGVVSQAPVAHACEREAAPALSAKTQAQKANLRLGMGEDELFKRFGKPQKRGWEPVRCPTNRIYLTYAKSIVVVQPKQGYKLDHRLESQHNYPQPQSLSQAKSSDEKPSAAAFLGNSNLAVIGFTSQDPKVVLEGGIRVGMPTADAQERLASVCDAKTLQANDRVLSCQFSGEPVEVYLQQQAVTGFRIGVIRAASEDASL